MQPGNPYDPRFYLYENPPVARWFTGLPSLFIDADYSDTVNIPLNMNVWAYFAPFREVYIPMRLVSAIFGVLSVLLIFLVARNIYGTKAGIWSAAIASLSFDLIFYSRWTLTESVFIGLMMFTLYFYTLYLKSGGPNGKAFYAILTVAFLTLTLGTRSFTPLLLVPVLVISQFLIKRKRSNLLENAVFTVLLIIGVYVFLSVIYPAEVRGLAQQLHVVFSPFDVLGFSLVDVILTNIYRNSYLYVFGLALIVYHLYTLTKKKGGYGFGWIGKHIRSRKSSILISVLIVIYGLAFVFTRYAHPRYQVVLFIPLFMLSGKVMERFSKKPVVMYVLVLLVALNFVFMARAYPYYSEYQNFYLGKCGDYTISCSTTGWQNHVDDLQSAEGYLEALGNPAIMTNEFNLLTFYEGGSSPLPATQSFDGRCSEAGIVEVLQEYRYIVYWGLRGDQKGIGNDPYVCPYIRVLPWSEEASFRSHSLEGKDPESLEVKIYKLET